MLFSSFIFLSVFLPLLLFLYYAMAREYRNHLLLAASLVFYGWGEPRLLAVMMISILWNYLAAMAIDRCRRKIPRQGLLTVGIAADLMLLIYFKYMDFFIQNLNFFCGLQLPLRHIIMPIGISFYTFQAISYLVDVYRSDVKAERNLCNTGLYIAFFPQLIAGPIVKFHEISGQIRQRTESLPEFSAGLQRFIEGLAKKVLIANVMGETADAIFSSAVCELTWADAWVGALAYSLQIFFDFSGYSDMAIGLGHMFGFTIPENFNYPYMSTTLTEFWRRWHISLFTWFKEYLYIPLGGSHCSRMAVLRNLLIVFAVTGFWHGASWTFVFWGLWHGFFIILERLLHLNKKPVRAEFRWLMHFYLLLAVIVGWVFFRADNFACSRDFLLKMFVWKGFEPMKFSLSPLFITMFLFGLLYSTTIPRRVYEHFRDSKIFTFVWRMICCGLLLLVMMRLASASYNPFIYFRF